ncbi:MAG: NAD-dependent epimerase/dehydratase family protein [Desulfobacteraceae bacterium]|nr:NAD-dependent epimerase/dehydratase family protein [Desulfobacteraceae bacterium]
MHAVMLTGASGFIGSHVAQRLARDGCDVRLWLRTQSNIASRLDIAGARIFPGFGAGDALLKDALRGADTVVHCAGATRAPNRQGYFEANTDLTLRLLDALRPSHRLVYISSLAAAGPSSPFSPVDETSPPAPISHYGESKLAAEAHVRQWGSQNGNNFVILRPGVVYGPREKNLYHYFKWVRRGVLPLLGNGERRFSIVYVDDMVDAVMAAINRPVSGEAHFVANNDPCSLTALGSAIRKALGNPRLIPLRLPAAFFDAIAVVLDAVSSVTGKPAVMGRQKVLEMKQQAWLCSNRSLREKFGWEARVSLEEGIRRTAEWYIREKWL